MGCQARLWTGTISWLSARLSRRPLIGHVSENGPSLVIADTYRRKAHSRSDRDGYRDKEEIKKGLEKDPIIRFQNILLMKGC